MGIIQQDGFDFRFDSGRCESCRGDCCRGASGNVWVNLNEMRRISAFLKRNNEHGYKPDGAGA
jgi:hypothetical protein